MRTGPTGRRRPEGKETTVTQPQDPQESAGNETASPPPPPRRPQRRLIIATCLAVVLGFTALAVPTPFIVELPGPALNTLGKVNEKQIISVDGHESFPAKGSLDMTTIYVLGGAQTRIPFLRVLQAWVNPHEDVYPEEALYPRGATDDQISDRNAAEMDDSQQSSIAAALGSLDIGYTQELRVAGLATDTNKGLLQTNDVLKDVNGKPITDLDMLKASLRADKGGKPHLTVVRSGKKEDVSAKTTMGDDGQPQLGVYLGTKYTFPFDVKFGLSNVGGPSAGMMLALGIVDTLTDGDMTGGKAFAGTGTIDADGNVGPIGGIAQKLVGAQKAGAEYFLAPADNCADVVGRVPDGLTVIKVSTLDEARKAVESIGSGADSGSLPGCS